MEKKEHNAEIDKEKKIKNRCKTNSRFTISQYGELAYGKNYPLYLIQGKKFDSAKPNILITGGVHGYETSGRSSTNWRFETWKKF